MGKRTANCTALNSDFIEQAQTPIGWQDRPYHFGRISRALHWLTAALVMFQFLVVLAWRVMGENTMTLLLAKVGPHGSLGILILIVTLARISWAWVNRRQRPPSSPGLGGRLARIVHVSFYVLLLWLPALALLRQYGRGGAIQFYGFELLPEAEREIAWLMAPADVLHSPLSWLLFALIIGHVTMVLIHRFWFKDNQLARMLSR